MASVSGILGFPACRHGCRSSCCGRCRRRTGRCCCCRRRSTLSQITEDVEHLFLTDRRDLTGTRRGLPVVDVIHPIHQVEAGRMFPPRGTFKWLASPAETHLPIAFLDGQTVQVVVMLFVGPRARHGHGQQLVPCAVPVSTRTGNAVPAIDTDESPYSVIQRVVELAQGLVPPYHFLCNREQEKENERRVITPDTQERIVLFILRSMPDVFKLTSIGTFERERERNKKSIVFIDDFQWRVELVKKKTVISFYFILLPW